MAEALKVVQELDRLEEEEFMKKALAESSKLEDIQKKRLQDDEDEEMKMIQQAIEMSRLEEEARLQKEQQISNEQISATELLEAERRAKEEGSLRA